MKKSLATLFLITFFAAGLYADAAESVAARSFQLQFRDASRAAVVIKPLITEKGSVSIQPSSNTLVVTDLPERLAEVARILGEYDAPAKSFTIDLKLVTASTSQNPSPVPPDLKEISSKLGGVLRFNQFEKIGELVTSGREGTPVLIDIDGGYRAEFRLGEFDPLSRSLRLEDFRLSRVPQRGGELQQLLKTSINLRLGQTVALGASRDPGSTRALMIVLRGEQSE
jgi:hypothetical protein